ncbi:sodium-dependent bicarbonate transport family permease [Fulvivirga sedimenti]|uniref:Sodium-dependent bicarbonate transport family permease n=1 Tax=Fulvivirga sedimenti TaxID=2879465 RepID=A0A9X1KYF4_9BACT|nr:sodium-dependent bicarbonate transport family permease [Fulvivirga sedimenti]MCA6074740.1 sodium-dependent bicarbonate transport family permease [Fulvivirga sedimenti]MCA6075917.1 sodium-dependent bicarbonate transport family permease [Fulvivirga sedimenti]MCA6077045.1 sodium-dependent bicarbonate transport family permease [Fulvivirga sedimenti]
MSSDILIQNLLNPAVLFFFLGLLAVFIRSDLEIPQPIPKFLSLYLLLSIGVKGGVELSHSGITSHVMTTLGIAVFMSLLVPLYSFYILKKRVSIYDAGAIAATYGSISAVTFITATSFLKDLNIEYGGHMVAAMALMESPAIIVGVLLINIYRKDKNDEETSYGSIIKEALTNGSVVLILGSLIIGLLGGERTEQALEPFTGDIFKGMLAFFLLDMGLLAGKRIRSLRKAGSFLILFSLIIPVINAAIGIALCQLFHINIGDSLLLVVLLASASYIAVPAAIRITVPEANPGLYVPMSLAITFPFNIILGIPVYYHILEYLNLHT